MHSARVLPAALAASAAALSLRKKSRICPDVYLAVCARAGELMAESANATQANSPSDAPRCKRMEGLPLYGSHGASLRCHAPPAAARQTHLSPAGRKAPRAGDSRALTPASGSRPADFPG